jgi:hypothetical protein
MSSAMARVPHPTDPAPAPGVAHPRHVRLRDRIRALLARRRPATRPVARTSPPPGSSWPDSFFDVEPGP